MAQTRSDGAEPGGQGKQRKRGSRGGQNRRPSGDEANESATNRKNDVEFPERLSEGRPSVEASERGLVRKPQIGDTMPIPSSPPPGISRQPDGRNEDETPKKKRNRRGKGGGGNSGSNEEYGNHQQKGAKQRVKQGGKQGDGQRKRSRGGRGGRGKGGTQQLDEAWLEQRRGRERNGKPIGRYFMCVQSRPGMAQVAVLEGRSLIEHYVSRPADDVAQIHGNVYVGKVQNVLPGMEAAFVDIATPKNAVLYRSDVQYDPADIEQKGSNARIEDILKNKQLILCQVTKNPIAHKGARLTQEISLPGRFVVLIPNSQTYGISKRLPDDVRKRLRGVLDRVKPEEHGLIVRTAAESATEEELTADMTILLNEWEEIERKAAKAQRPTLLYREPELAVRVIREEFNADYRGVIIDDERLHHDVHSYVAAFNPDLADRIEYYSPEKEGLSLFERHHVHEQVHKALDRKVWLPSGGSLIIESTEALTVIDVNTGKNVGKSNLEETVFHNNMEAAVEVAKQLRLRDIGGIIVIDFIDMEIRENRGKVVDALRDALARDKTRSQVFDVSELGLVEMTRKRIGEGLLPEYSETCSDCDGRGVVVDYRMLE
ncbi:Rne/Rng family ribonuclease [uncultured Ilumatobacter sp.]|uniref:Rne/Rng family ribonuclease n=1 Tax=uncultured Ilumatobacter sp. TaxID=879968 RepID=UPI00374E3BAA